MEIIHQRCCGLDVHKETVAACLLVEEGGQVHKEIRTYGTMTRDLEVMADWLADGGCTHVAMESTGVYWKPIYNILENRFDVILANAKHIKTVPGRKTDVRDCEWIAQLLRHGLLRGSFVPAQWQRELRDLTRHRKRLAYDRASVANRVQKVLEDANIKLGSVATDVLGKSGLAMIEAMITGNSDPEALANMALGRLKDKKDSLKLALQGHVTDHHRYMLRELLDHLKYLDTAIERVSHKIEEKMHPFEEAVCLLDTIPGVDRRTAESLIAEIGTEMKQFPSADHLASWAGMCPGNNESAGKHKSGKTRKGSPWLRATLVEAGWAASRTKKTYFKAQYHRLAGRRGKKRAIIAVGHSILVTVYHILQNGVVYRELGEDFFDRLQGDRLTRYLVKRLESLGHQVILQPASQAA